MKLASKYKQGSTAWTQVREGSITFGKLPTRQRLCAYRKRPDLPSNLYHFGERACRGERICPRWGAKQPLNQALSSVR